MSPDSASAADGFDRPRLGRLAGLLALAAVLGAVVAVDLPPRLAPPTEEPKTPLLGVPPSTVVSIEVAGRGERGRFERVNGGWTRSRSGGSPEPADAGLVDGFLDQLARLGRLTQFVEADLGAFGLAPPRGSIVLRGKEEATILLGDRNPPLTALYVQVLPAPDIVLVGSVLLWEYDKLLAEIRGAGASR